MSKQKNSPRGGAEGKGRGSAKINVQDHSTPSPQFLQAPFDRHFSSLLDQAIFRIERHTRLARFHYQQASLHREMKSYLERYLFGGDL